jgi:UDP-N-acetylmuramate dehydrogenase
MQKQDPSPSGAGAVATPSHTERVSAVARVLASVPDLEVRRDERMDRHTSLGVGGPADLYVIPSTVPAICAVLSAARSHELPLLVTGRGTNLLVRDGGFRGMVLCLGEPFSALSSEGDRVIAQSGATLSEVCEFAANAGLSGLEFAAGIPGSVGGAVAMNAGTQSGVVADVIETVEIVNSACEVTRCRRGDLEFAYRRSCLRDRDCVALTVTFHLRPDDPRRIKEAMLASIERRCRRQPLSLGSAGSVFKRPPGDFAGRLLEEAGCKGLKIGGATFSRKHANFIVNEGSATAGDILALMETARQRVHDHFGLWLEPEICVVGEHP